LKIVRRGREVEILNSVVFWHKNVAFDVWTQGVSTHSARRGGSKSEGVLLYFVGIITLCVVLKEGFDGYVEFSSRDVIALETIRTPYLHHPQGEVLCHEPFDELFSTLSIIETFLLPIPETSSRIAQRGRSKKNGAKISKFPGVDPNPRSHVATPNL
jgi:hypothetical protein